MPADLLPPLGAGTPLLAALAYAAAGWPVLPVHTPARYGGCSCGRAGCRKPGKHPRTARGLLDATTEAATIAAWWSRWPRANVGVRTGALVVLDVDGREGAQSLAAIEAAHVGLPATRRVRTARGEHIYFYAAAQEVNCSAAQLGVGLDVRGRGGYVIAPPSLHANGSRYSWNQTRDVASLPAWLAALLADARPEHERARLPSSVVTAPDARGARYLRAALAGEVAAVARAPVGARNDVLNRAAFRLGQIVGAGLGSSEQVVEPLMEVAQFVGLSDREALSTIRSGLRAGEAHPRPGVEGR